jgi:hypothetical protein
MNSSVFAIYSVLHSNLEGLIELQYCQYTLYQYPEISDETPIGTIVMLPSIQYSILIQRALLNVNIVNIHLISTLEYLLKLQYEP